MISFKQFIEANLPGVGNPNSMTLHPTGRNQRRNIASPNFKTANDLNMKGPITYKSPRVKAIASGQIKKAFLTNDEAAEFASIYDLELPNEGEEKQINSNSNIVIGRTNNKYHVYTK